MESQEAAADDAATADDTTTTDEATTADQAATVDKSPNVDEANSANKANSVDQAVGVDEEANVDGASVAVDVANTGTDLENVGEEFNEASSPFEGRWNRLISTTNWEKGQIIFEWRTALKSADAPATELSDEAWAQRVGGVTGQHVGRLRRVFERFGETNEQYEGLFWSHFQAALDWDDAELWLEGGIQNKWSVSKMRKARWEALGAPEELKPKDEDVIAMEINEDLDTREDHQPQLVNESCEAVGAPVPEGPVFGDEDELESGGGEAGASGSTEEPGASIYAEDQDTVPFVRPFENLADLPEDLSEAFESFKLCIIRHKANEWQEISREDTLGTLEALKELALAPATGSEGSF